MIKDYTIEKSIKDKIYSPFDEKLCLENAENIKEFVVENRVKKIEKYIEDKLWSVDNGLEKLLSSVNRVDGIKFNSDAPYKENGNPIYEIERLIEEVPECEDLVVVMSYENFTKYMNALGIKGIGEMCYVDEYNKIKVLGISALYQSDAVYAFHQGLIGVDVSINVANWNVKDDGVELSIPFSYGFDVDNEKLQYCVWNGL